MKLYHSSTQTVEHPDTLHSRDYLDFGKGFYLTSIYDQAVRYGQRFIRRNRPAWLNTYEFSGNVEGWKVLRFESYNKAWLDFVSKCRAGEDDTDYDMVVAFPSGSKTIMQKIFNIHRWMKRICRCRRQLRMNCVIILT